MLLVAFAGALSWEALRRFGAPPEIPAMPVIVVAAIGIAVNLGGAWMMRGGHGHDEPVDESHEFDAGHGGYSAGARPDCRSSRPVMTNTIRPALTTMAGATTKTSHSIGVMV